MNPTTDHPLRRAALHLAVAASIGLVGSLASIAPAARAGATFSADPVAIGLNEPVAFTFAPNGRIFYVERTSGGIRILNPATSSDRLFSTVSRVDGTGERGMLGIALHPRYPVKPFVYVYLTRMVKGRLKNQIVRFENTGGSPSGQRTIFSTPASSSPYHNGGRILFGPDRKLYAIVGEGHRPANSQDLTNPRGKILRMSPTGARPRGNPFPHSLIFAFGIRNSFGFAFDPVSQDLWETENGPACNDELNRIARGGRNYGWGPRQSCGSLPAPRDTNNSGPRPRFLPELWYTNTVGITGIAFCDGCGLPGSEGDVFFGDVNFGQIRRVPLSPDRTNIADVGTVVFDTGNVLSMETGPDGGIYFSDFSGIYHLVPA